VTQPVTSAVTWVMRFRRARAKPGSDKLRAARSGSWPDWWCAPFPLRSVAGETALGRPPSAGTDTGQSANLDLLRSFAVLAVLAAHCCDALRINTFYYVGQTGVLLFFVHTSLVLLSSLRRLHADGAGQVARRFLIQRVFRIYPLYLAAIAFSLALRVPWIDALGPHPSMLGLGSWLGLKSVAANLLLVQNLTFSPSVSSPMWSLPYEMQMYLALPAVYALTAREKPLDKLFLVSLIAGAAAFLQRAFVPLPYDGMHPPLTYFVPCFLGGAYAFASARKRRQIKSAVPPVALPLLLTACAALFSIERRWPFDWVICTVLGLLLPVFTELRNTGVRSICHAIAKYSYGIYLWHWPLLWLWFRKIDGLPILGRFILFFFSLALLCMGSYHALEEPLIRIGRWVARPTPSRNTMIPCESVTASQVEIESQLGKTF
jgi:peptidoglycan/LPS O-acetylase OafA/YrhL